MIIFFRLTKKNDYIFHILNDNLLHSHPIISYHIDTSKDILENNIMKWYHSEI